MVYLLIIAIISVNYACVIYDLVWGCNRYDSKCQVCFKIDGKTFKKGVT